MTELRRAARRYQRAQEARDRALTDLQHAIRDADAEGTHSRNQIAAASGLARQTAFDALHAKDRDTHP